MKHNNIDMNISHVYDWYHSLGPSADHRLTGEPGISRFPLRGGKRTGFAGSRQATENPVNPSLCGKSRTAGIGVHCCGAAAVPIFPPLRGKCTPSAFGSSPGGGAKSFLLPPSGEVPRSENRGAFGSAFPGLHFLYSILYYSLPHQQKSDGTGDFCCHVRTAGK